MEDLFLSVSFEGITSFDTFLKRLCDYVYQDRTVKLDFKYLKRNIQDEDYLGDCFDELWEKYNGKLMINDVIDDLSEEDFTIKDLCYYYLYLCYQLGL